MRDEANALERVERTRDRFRTTLANRLIEHVARLSWTDDDLVHHQTEQLRRLLAWCQRRSPFHARRLKGVEVETFELHDLQRLPTMTKSEMMASFDGVVTDERICRDSVDRHIAALVDQPVMLWDSYVCLASGGSSGQRGVFVQTLDEFADFVASLLRRRAEATPGGPAAFQAVIALVGAASAGHSTGFGAAISHGGQIRLIAEPAALPIAELVARLNALQPPALMGYPSKLAQLAREQLAGRLRISPRAVTATSELLTEEDRDMISRGFGVPVVDQFASTEGLVGQSDPGGQVLTFASDMCFAELVDDRDQLVPQGTPASKVLVTNLHNFTQPLIRYELTDRFVADRPAQGHLRARVDGRSDSLFRYGDMVIHPLVVRTVMVKEPAVVEYQVRQTERGIDTDVVACRPLQLTSLAAALEHSLTQAGLSGASVTLRQVDHIARSPESGKIRRFVPIASS